MPRKNFNTKHGRRRQAKPSVTVIETDTISLGEMAQGLVDRGLATAGILDYTLRLDQSKENRRRGTTLEGRHPT